MKNKLINTTRGWDKERIRVPDKNPTHDLPNIGRAVYSLSCENHWRTRSFVTGVLHTARACTVEVIVGMLLNLGTDKRGTGLWGRFLYSTKYPGLKFRVFHATNGTAFSGSLDYPVPGHLVPSFARKYEIKRRTVLPLFTCFGLFDRLR